MMLSGLYKLTSYSKIIDKFKLEKLKVTFRSNTIVASAVYVARHALGWFIFI